MPPRKNCAAKPPNPVAWLRFIRRPSRLSPADQISAFSVEKRSGLNEAIGRGSSAGLARKVQSGCADAHRLGQQDRARKAGITNLRIALQTLSISEVYLRTIESSSSIALASLPIGNSGLQDVKCL